VSETIRILRCFIAIVVALSAIRIYSYLRERKRRGAREFLSFLSIGLFSPHLVYSKHRYDSRPVHKGQQIARMLIALLVMPLAWMGAKRLIVSEASRNSWLVNHLIVLAGFVIIMQAFGQFCYAKWRLRGLRVRPLIDNILLSRTPADFWRRWSWPMHAWLYRYVYLPSGGRRHLVRAVLAVFFVNGLMHEAVAFVAIGRVTGHQTLYFMVSALGVLASPALERLSSFGWAGEALMRAITLTFLGASAALMFVSIHYVTPIYVKHIWLMW
jgi:hypothetical protein